MKSLNRILPLTAFAIVIFLLPNASARSGQPYPVPGQPYAPINSLADETARVLAGLPIRGGHGLEALANSEAARNHAIAMEEMWQQWERFRLANMRFMDGPPGYPQRQVVHYFSADISDSGINSNGRYLAYLKQQPPGGAYLKAASYLMHGGNFTRIRSFLTDQSLYLLQDASGVPVRHIDPAVWEIQLYGR